MEPQPIPKSPFLIVTIKCPICEFSFQICRFKVSLFAVTDRDSDQRPKTYKWTDNDFSNILPHYYAVARCPRCLFTDFQETFECVTQDAKMHAFKRFYKAQPLGENNFLMEMVKSTEQSMTMTFESAMNLHLTAAYIHDLPTKSEAKNCFKLAKLYLRIAWLYREKYGNVTVENQSEFINGILKSIADIDGLFSKIEKLSAGLAGNIKSRVEELYHKAPEVPLNNPYYANMAGYFAGLKNMSAFLNKIKAATIADQHDKLFANNNQQQQAGYFRFPTYPDFLAHLSGLWREMPLTEKDAIRLAVKYYDLSYTNEDVFDTQEKRLKAVDIISELYLRLEDFESAINYVLEIHRSGNKERQNLYKKLNTTNPDGTPLSFIEKSRVEAQIARINIALNKASDKRKELEEKQIIFYMAVVIDTVGKFPDLSEDELVEKLETMGVSRSVFKKIMERNQMPNVSLTLPAAEDEKHEEESLT